MSSIEYPVACIQDPKYGEDLENRIALRMQTIEVIFNAIQKKGFFDRDNVSMNRAILFTAIESYYKDLDRTKCFHHIEQTDEHKKAAFTVKWLVKFRPIQINNSVNDKKINESHILINELFAIFFALVLLELDFQEISRISSKYLKNLVYTCHFRESNDMVFSSLMYLLQRGLKQQLP